jgi:hypothetical protein
MSSSSLATVTFSTAASAGRANVRFPPIADTEKLPRVPRHYVHDLSGLLQSENSSAGAFVGSCLIEHDNSSFGRLTPRHGQ